MSDGEKILKELTARVKKMFFWPTVSAVYISYFDDRSEKRKEHSDESLDFVFKMVRFHLGRGDFRLDMVSASKIVMTVTYKSMDPQPDGLRLRRTVHSWQGDPALIGLVIEYIHWWHQSSPVPRFNTVVEPDRTKASLLPSLVLNSAPLDGWPNEADKKVLDFYGFGKADIGRCSLGLQSEIKALVKRLKKEGKL